MNHIEELKATSPDTLRILIGNVASMVRSTSRFSGLPLWSVVGTACGVGSRSAQLLCLRANLDPHQLVTRSISAHGLINTPASNAEGDTEHGGSSASVTGSQNSQPTK